MEIKKESNKEFFEKLSRIALFVMDVDGTMTDGSLHYSHKTFGPETFYVQDGMGIHLLHKYAIKTCIMTAGESPIVKKRAKHLQIPYLFLGIKTKKEQLIQLTENLEISLDQVAYIGDDVNDAPAMSISGISFCPSDAHPMIIQQVDCVTPFPGGRGAIRFACDLILSAKGYPLSLEDGWK
ncbi:MAG: HAD hydrolase family protein [Chlamydia sp.]